MTSITSCRQGDPDPLVNEVTATGLGTQSESLVDDTAQCETDVIHPAIEIVKTVDEETVPFGTTVTYTYVVTNTVTPRCTTSASTTTSLVTSGTSRSSSPGSRSR